LKGFRLYIHSRNRPEGCCARCSVAEPGAGINVRARDELKLLPASLEAYLLSAGKSIGPCRYSVDRFFLERKLSGRTGRNRFGNSFGTGSLAACTGA
jgi:hypothetical protein